MPVDPQMLTEFYARTGYKKLNRNWAKVEIVLGLCAAFVGILAGVWAVNQLAVALPLAGSLVLFVLGWYLALAGHRSHLYQSANENTVFLIEEIKSLIPKDR